MALGRSKKRLGDLLLDEGLITGEQLEKALKLAKETGNRKTDWRNACRKRDCYRAGHHERTVTPAWN